MQQQPWFHEDDGAELTEVALIFPLTGLLLLAGVQAAFFITGTIHAHAAAEQGARTAALQHSSAGAGEAATRNYLATDRGVQLRNLAVTRTATTATVTITIQTPSLVGDLWRPTETVQVSRPVERIT